LGWLPHVNKNETYLSGYLSNSNQFQNGKGHKSSLLAPFTYL
jgi:hypothetical protein